MREVTIMLRHQWVAQKAHEMALHYVVHAGVVYSPAVFIQKVREMEGVFSRILLAEQEGKIKS
ncbi:hypothetical protein CLM69_05995 [Serratia marcescens]|nr:hypothetical protein BVG90_01305 [Serratia marcescens]RLO39734.1 hypothetical protein CLM69_05995 [Serratia marcescens]RLO45287.1 hypothetical protein CLM68_09760 [Serratia marcescens]